MNIVLQSCFGITNIYSRMYNVKKIVVRGTVRIPSNADETKGTEQINNLYVQTIKAPTHN